MCRAKGDGGRRCPCRDDPAIRRLESARQRVSRYARQAQSTQDVEQREHAESLFSLALADVQDGTHTPAPPAVPTPPPTRAAGFSRRATMAWSEDELAAALGDCWDDQQAIDAITARLDERDQERSLVKALPVTTNRSAWTAWTQLEKESANTNMLDKPGYRPASRLTADQQARTDWETMKEVWFLSAEDECAGHLLNQRGRAAGIDPRSLWTGSDAHALTYASPELEGWFARHGRITWTAFRGQAFGRRSDRAAVENARTGKAFADAITV